MDTNAEHIFEIFFPYYSERKKRIQNENLKLVHYTSAECALSIIKNREVWLRNSRCMNDFSEVEHGFDCLFRMFHGENEGKKFEEYLNKLFPGIINDLFKLFDSWWPSFRSGTYILSLSEHLPQEDKYGRLSMWRAYGNSNSVALVLNNVPFITELNNDLLKAYSIPINYACSCAGSFDALRMRIEENEEFIVSLGKDVTIDYLFYMLKIIIQGIKHPGFKEEREWRVVYTPFYQQSKYIKAGIETINGVPQKIYKLSIENIPEIGFNNVNIPDLVDRIIIGPNDHQEVLQEAFTELLTEAGCKNSSERVHISGIPLR